jgi:hypothetical protein
MWCIQAITEEYRTRMYYLLELYQQAYDPNQPLVCMDEKSKQLLEDNRQPILAKPGQLENYFPKASCIQLVLDNLNTHFATSIIEAFDKKKADRLLERIKFIHTLKHGSWLNMAEIEINIMDRQCTVGRIANKETLESEVMIWSNDRNEKQRNIEWKFTRQDADKKLSRHYVA